MEEKMSALEAFMRNPTFTAYRRLKRELALSGHTPDQFIPDLAPFLAWKGKHTLLTQIHAYEEKNRRRAGQP